MATEDIGPRLELALSRAKGRRVAQEALAKAIGTDQGTISRIINGRQSGEIHVEKIAAELGVPVEWLRFGDNPPAWARPKVHETDRIYRPGGAVGHTEMDQPAMLSLVGTVTAGDGLVSYEEAPRAFIWKRSWAVMRVEGDSAYPVVYPEQLVVIDTDRPLRHNNLVVVQVDNEPAHLVDQKQPKVKAFLKRYCVAADAPDGFVLASVNSGRDSPYIPKVKIIVMVPVIGVFFEE